MNTKFAFSGRNWPLFFIWLIFLDLRLFYPSPNPGCTCIATSSSGVFCCVCRAVKLAGWDLFVSVFGGRWVDVWAPWVDESSEITPNPIQSLES